MTMSRVLAVCAACYVAGVLTQAGLAQGKKPAFDPAIFEGSAPAVGTKLLDGALALAEQGSWERIAVGRAWYLGGDKARGQQIFDGVTSSRKVEGSDGSASVVSMPRPASGRRRARRSTRRWR